VTSHFANLLYHIKNSASSAEIKDYNPSFDFAKSLKSFWYWTSFIW